MLEIDTRHRGILKKFPVEKKKNYVSIKKMPLIADMLLGGSSLLGISGVGGYKI